jgi:hypothetical protein
MRSLRKNLPKLLRLRRAKLAERRRLLDDADDSLVQCICETAHNCLKSNIPLTRAQYRKLSRHKNTLRLLSRKGDSISKKRKIIKQSGGFVLPLLAPLLGWLIGKVLP